MKSVGSFLKQGHELMDVTKAAISKVLLQRAIDAIKETCGNQFVEVEGSFYPVCVACGRTNIEHNMGKKIDCSYENNTQLIEELESL
jgi:hypothetical protein